VRSLYLFNYESVYRHPRVARQRENVHHIIKLLFERLFEYVSDRASFETEKPQVFTQLDYFMRYTDCEHDALPAQVVMDFISGMTDNYAVRCFEELYIPRGIR
jgi:dGTPase